MPANLNISILGAGWLGLPLAQHLLTQGYNVHTTRSSQAGCDQINSQFVPCSVFELGENFTDNQSVAHRIFNADILIVTIPPGFRQVNKGQDYLLKWRQITTQANLAGVKKIIMTSSTSVYPEQDKLMLETDATAHNEKADILLQAENLLTTDFNGDYIIVRLAGLFGPDRHPARFIKHMKTLSQQAPANMLHLDDAIKAISFLIDKAVKNEIINISSPERVSKADFYKQAIKIDGQILNLFPKLDKQKGKHINCEKLIKLGYQFKFKNAINALKSC
ncbi:NAD(P)H-binding protein [Catenovulum sp. 2E275]|uniref:NAD(P)H-binding protein n=1 Tax=Catenovulum sp. 2E275 TaxID=2980497 RepID=UPI0021D1A4BA|nr:NAD(P)H-binding protein [Catenovulum sp. 2E275]MCU4674333.1 NAD(P)H-binding protein [Catenovulum sp. 2E275]